jgi:hypothetical protein
MECSSDLMYIQLRTVDRYKKEEPGLMQIAMQNASDNA